MLESAIFVNFKPIGVSDSLGERIRDSVGNAELTF